MSQTAPQTNGITFASLLADAVALGSAHGKGKDTWTQFLLKTAEAAYHGAIDTTADKHGAGVDDAQKLTETYIKAQTGASIFDAKGQNGRKASSCTRRLVRIGAWTKGGPGEPITSMNNLMTLRQKAKANPTEAKKLDDPSNTLLRWARTQHKMDRLIDDADLKQFIFKADPALRTPEQIIDSIRKELRNLVAGKCSHGTAQDASSHVKKAIEELDARMVEIAKAKAPANHVAPKKVA